MRCRDCGLDMEGHGLDHHDEDPKRLPEHVHRCCDCADELYGVPASMRLRPRPETMK